MYDEDLTNLDEWLRRLKVEYDIFFNGHRKKPPDDLKMRVERLANKLSEASDMSFQQRFRYNTLVSRFYVYRDLWRRTVMEKELGLSPGSAVTAKPAVPAASQAHASKAGIQVSIVDPRYDESKIKELYDSLVRIAGEQAKERPRISIQQFTEYIARQTRAIKGKYGCASVIFSVCLEEDTIKFTARAGSPG